MTQCRRSERWCALTESERYSLTTWRKGSLTSTKRHPDPQRSKLTQIGWQHFLTRMQPTAEHPSVQWLPAYLPERIPCLGRTYGRWSTPSAKSQSTYQRANHTPTGNAQKNRTRLQMQP